MLYVNRFLCAVLPALFLATAAPADEPVVFRYKLDRSDRLIYEVTAVIDQTQKLNGQEFKNKIKSSEVSIRTLQEVDDKGNFLLQSENKTLNVEMNIGPLGEFLFDSKSSEREKGTILGAALTPLYETLSGAVVTIVVSPHGELIKVEGFTDLLAEVLKDNALAQQFASGTSDEGAKSSIGETFIHFSDKALKPGDSWEVPFKLKLPNVGMVNGKSKYTYDGPGEVAGRKTIKFTESGEVTIDLDTTSGGAKVTGSLSSTDSTSTIHVDPQKGWVVSKSGKTTLSGNLTVEAGGQTINIEQNQTHLLTVKLLDKLPD